MRSIFSLAVLLSLATTTFAHAATPLEQYARQGTLSDLSGPSAQFPASPAAMQRASTSSGAPGGVVKPPQPRAAVGDEHWACQLLSAGKQGCGFYRFYRAPGQDQGRDYYPEEMHVFTTSGQPTGEVMRAPLSAPWEQASATAPQAPSTSSPTWQQAQASNPHRDGMPQGADHYQVIEPTAAGGVIQYGKERKPSFFEGLLAVAVVGASVYDNYNYGYGGYGSYGGGYGGNTFAPFRGGNSICSNNCSLALPGDPRPGGGGLQRR